MTQPPLPPESAPPPSPAPRRNVAPIVVAVIGAVVVVAVIAAGITAFLLTRHGGGTTAEGGSHTDCVYTDAPFDWEATIASVEAQVKAAPADQKAQGEAYLTLLREGSQKQRSAPKPPSKAPDTGTVTMTLKTNDGDVPMTLDRAKAPCNVNALVSLSKDGYYNGTSCHRLVAKETLSVLQCGDPTGTGASGPGWTSPDELPIGLATAPGDDTPFGMDQAYIYPRGTLAIANRNDPSMGTTDTGSAQFFIVTRDSRLPATLTIVGHVGDAGMRVIDDVARGGIIPGAAGTADDGNPKTPLDIEHVDVRG
ncbi:peptidylprolyl isomerase [Gordonia sp. (in: high G+C Gram-positive bacteria)]|uniref:peptidylprolyl isomerase n=1 Tax=Gordonia sp. (in: high G+C Gram-positive bacteria) TaxID=84139 RepID=UPI003528BE42